MHEPSAIYDATPRPAPRRAVRLRLTLAVYLAAIAFAVGCTVFGLCHGRTDFLLAAALLAFIAGLLRLLLREPLPSEEIQMLADETPSVDAAPPADLTTPADLAALLHRREQLEANRGTVDFDPWELQEVRSKICFAIVSDPSLVRHLRN